MRIVCLGRAGGPADAVAARGAAQQDHHVPRHRALAAHVLFRRRCNHRADFHALGRIAGMVELVHDARRKADLVAVAGIARSSRGDDLALAQLARDRILDRNRRVRRAGDAHGAIYIRPAGERIADGAADAGGRSAEGLDLRGMVMGFILEQQKPGFLFAVHLDRHLDGAGVDFLGFIQPGQLSLRLQGAHAHRRQVHERDGPIVPAQFPAHLQVALILRCKLRVFKLHVLQMGEERGVPAVVRPVGVDHPDLRNGRVPLLGFEVRLAESQVVRIHGQSHFLAHLFQALAVQRNEPVHCPDGGGNGKLHFKGFRLFQGRFPGLHRVDHVFLDRFHIFRRQFARKHVNLGRMHQRPLSLGEDLNALSGAVRPLVKLSGQILHGKHGIAGFKAVRNHVRLGLAEHGGNSVVKERLFDVFGIIPVQDAQPGQIADVQEVPAVRQERTRFMGMFPFLFHKYPVNHAHASIFSAR